MKRLTILALACAGLASSCNCDSGSQGADAGSLKDAGPVTPLDAGTGAADAGLTGVDAGTSVDSGVVPLDAGVADAGTTPGPGDAGTPTVDAGMTAIDSGVMTPDAAIACGTPVRIQLGTSAQLPDPDVSLDSAGNANVVWKQAAAGSGLISIHSARYAGGLWSSPVVVAADAGRYGQKPRIATSANGDALAVWVEENGSTGSFLWAAHYVPPSGWAAPVSVSSTDFDVTEADLAMDGAGNGVVVFSQNVDASGFTATWLARFQANGATWSTPVRIDGYTNTVSLTTQPRVGVAPDGTTVVAWVDQATNPANIIGTAFLSDGGMVARATLDATPNNVTRPALSINAKGEAVVVWQQYRGGATAQWEAAFATFNSGFVPGGVADFVDGGTIVWPQVSVDSSGNAWAAWQQTTPTSQQRARGAFFSPSVGWSGLDVDRTLSFTSSTDVAVGVDSNGTGLIVWDDSGLYAVKVSAGAAGAPVPLSGQFTPNALRPRVVARGGKALVIFGAYDTTHAVWAVWCQ